LSFTPLIKGSIRNEINKEAEIMEVDVENENELKKQKSWRLT